MSRGQASLEYLVTYGWAFLVILVIIGGLSYFGVLNPSRWVPDKCDFGTQLECVDYQLLSGNAASTGIYLYVRNSFGKNITILGANVKLEDGTMMDEPDFSVTPSANIPSGSTATINIQNLPTMDYLKKNSKQQVVVVVTFEKTGGTAAHNLTGVVYATVK